MKKTKEQYNKYVNDYIKGKYNQMCMAIKPMLYNEYKQVRTESGMTRQEFFDMTFKELKRTRKSLKHYRYDNTPEEQFIQSMFKRYGKLK